MTRHQPDTRGMSTPLSHVLSVGITTILLVGLVSGAAGFLDSQSERTARQEMDTIANRLASELDQADTLGRQGDNVTLKTTHKQTIAGSTYTAQLADASGDCTATSTSVCLKVAATEYEYKATINVTNETKLSLREVESGEFVIRSTGGSANVQAPTRSLDLSARVGIGGDVGAGPPPGVGTALQQSPIASFTYRPGLPKVDKQLEFDASKSSDPDGSISKYEWDWDDDGSIDDTGVTHPHTFFNPGFKNVTLRVTDDSGTTANYTREIRVSGLEYNGDLQNVTESTEGVTFTVRNRHSEEIEIDRVFIDPTDNSLFDIDERTSMHEVTVDGTESGYADRDIALPDDGAIVSVGEGGGDDPIELDSGETARISIRYFDRNMQGEEITFGIRYKIGESYDATVFDPDTVDS